MCMRDIDTRSRVNSDVHYVALCFKFFKMLYSVNNKKITQRVDGLFEPDRELMTIVTPLFNSSDIFVLPA